MEVIKMSFYNFKPRKDSAEYKYLKKNGGTSISIANARYNHLFELAHRAEGKLKVALRDPKTNRWTKWLSFFTSELNGGFSQETLEMGYDVHRSLLQNEIVIESDYEDYKDNVDASRLIGKMVEPKGFIPHYYYSGSKSIHVHIFIDFKAFEKLPETFFEKITKHFNSKEEFFESFLVWLRALMISCWGFNVKEFDSALIKSTHLIRSEMSLNKKGHKTFLGYTYKDLKDEAYLCNSETGNLPSIATNSTIIGDNQFEMKTSYPIELEATVAEFLDFYDIWSRINKNKRLSSNMTFNKYKPTKLRDGVKMILHDDFAKNDDGMKRALFIICNELKYFHTEAETISLVKDWNVRMGEPFREYDILYRIKKPGQYRLKTEYINSFLEELGIL
jgi:hypothetical protein